MICEICGTFQHPDNFICEFEDCETVFDLRIEYLKEKAECPFVAIK